MSSQQSNQGNATNWIILEDIGRPGVCTLYGPFSNAGECRESEANVFANIIRRLQPAADENGKGVEYHAEVVCAMEQLYIKPNSKQFLSVFLTDERVFEPRQLSISFKQAFQKDTAAAMRKLAAGEDLGKYKSEKELGNWLEIYSVSVRIHVLPWVKGMAKKEFNEDYLTDKTWRCNQYLEADTSWFDFEGNIEVFTNKEEAVAFAKSFAGNEEPNTPLSRLGNGVDRVLYEIPTGVAESPWKLITIDYDFIDKNTRVDWERI
jgi:hypothetical protein